MYDKDWCVYEKEIMKHIIIDEFFEDSKEIICMSKTNCKNIINNNTFCIWSYKTKKGFNKLKPICNNCNLLFT